MINKSLLVELLTEELPPKALKKLGEAFASGIAQGLISRKLAFADARVTSFATPRRLAVHIANVSAESPSEPIEVRLMPISVAFASDGQPTAALEKKIQRETGFATYADVPTNELSRKIVDGKEYLFHCVLAAGQPLSRGLTEALREALERLPIQKMMFYQRNNGTAVNFVRPAHRLIALYDSEIISIEALGLQSGRVTQGHRFHSSGDITIASADSYVDTLKQHHVVASFAERRAAIEQQLKAFANGDEVIAPDALLDEVNSLVEWPRVYECHFEKQFLEVPQECLILTMQTNQKYFATQRDGKLTNRFLIVSNIETTDASLIIGGNERVVRPRLADAKFFFDQDRKRTLESRVAELAKVVYHNKLGSQGERNKRVVSIAKGIAAIVAVKLPPYCNDQSSKELLISLAEKAARLSKSDLLTDMVSEFPELQGVMGYYYARNDGENPIVAKAIADHYKPRFSGDDLPEGDVGPLVALADKIETLVGMFGIGAVPTGDKDPYALRRHALGVIRLLREKRLQIQVNDLLTLGAAQFPMFDDRQRMNAQGLPGIFINERLMGQLREEGYTAQEVEAVLAQPPQYMSAISSILVAVRAFSQLPEAQSLAAANKRITNILKKAEGEVPATVDTKLLVEDAEKQLHGALQSVAPLAEKLFHNHEYTASLRELAVLRGPVDTFFDKVMVNAEDPVLRNNRLALLKQLHTAMNRVADLSKLAA